MSPTQLQPLPPGPHNGPHKSARLTVRLAGPVNGRLAAKTPHRVAHLGRVHLAAPQHRQQFLGVVGVLAGAGGPVALQTRLWWARARGVPALPQAGAVPVHPWTFGLGPIPSSALVSGLGQEKTGLLFPETRAPACPRPGPYTGPFVCPPARGAWPHGAAYPGRVHQQL